MPPTPPGGLARRLPYQPRSASGGTRAVRTSRISIIDYDLGSLPLEVEDYNANSIHLQHCKFGATRKEAFYP
ncbi:hypothetical protein HPP92_022366 [Vanilla planifolia]|uniref:Uncharacterized protein n=1 Tax=Vanilla planifolia TaxID=51239 RepID=A0A835UBV6_VANPL|nr:hypothetical protein HPP92_022366 [Vanilla planifolia]